MIALSVNLNKIALIRNSREGDYPSVSAFARRAVAAGADGITVHPRPDQRHIRASDLPVLAEALDMELNVEGNPFAEACPSQRPDVSDYPGFMALVTETRPTQATLVPDSTQQLTSDHGFDLHRDGDRLAPIIERLHSLSCRVSLFMDPDPEQIRLAAALGADRVELYTGPFAEAVRCQRDIEAQRKRYRRAAEAARSTDLGLNAGHDLNLDNLPYVRDWPGLREVSIGHALTVDALWMGFETAVRAYRTALNPA